MIDSEGFKWPIRVEKLIEAPAQDVWRVISAPGNLEQCHPFCRTNPVQEWPGPQSRDEIHYLSGLVYERRFTDWIEGEGYDLEIIGKGGTKSEVSWRITPLNDGRCTLAITLYPQALQGFPVFIRWIPQVMWMGPQLRSYLESVLQGIEWNVTRKERVPRNAFGTHAWFSAGG